MKTATALTATLIVTTTALTGCKGSQSADATSSSTATATTAAGTTADGTAATTSSCPTESTRTFAKTRFVADVGLAAGTFHRWIYKPYKAGTFSKGTQNNRLAIAKAVATAVADAKLLSNAYQNVQADPQLCKTLGEPLKKLTTSLNDLPGAIRSGSLNDIAASEGLVSSLLREAKGNGLSVTETTADSRS